MKFDIHGAMAATDKLASSLLHLKEDDEGKWQWTDEDTDTTEYLDGHKEKEKEPDLIEITRQVVRQLR